jgi:hypothetical protein
MHQFLESLPAIINRLFDALDLLVLRSSLLALVVVGAYTLLRSHFAH